MSWEGLKKEKEKIFQNKDKTRGRLDSLIVSVFNTEEGKLLIDCWKQIYLMAQVAIKDGVLDSDYAKFREGQNDFIRSEVLGAKLRLSKLYKEASK